MEAFTVMSEKWIELEIKSSVDLNTFFDGFNLEITPIDKNLNKDYVGDRRKSKKNSNITGSKVKLDEEHPPSDMSTTEDEDDSDDDNELKDQSEEKEGINHENDKPKADGEKDLTSLRNGASSVGVIINESKDVKEQISVNVLKDNDISNVEQITHQTEEVKVLDDIHTFKTMKDVFMCNKTVKNFLNIFTLSKDVRINDFKKYKSDAKKFKKLERSIEPKFKLDFESIKDFDIVDYNDNIKPIYMGAFDESVLRLYVFDLDKRPKRMVAAKSFKDQNSTLSWLIASYLN